MSNYEILHKKMREIIGYLYQKGPATPNEIADDIEMSYMAVKRWLNIIKEIGIVKIYEPPFQKMVPGTKIEKNKSKKLNKNNKPIIPRGPTERYILDLEKIYENNPQDNLAKKY